MIVTVPNIAYFRERLLLFLGRFNPGGSPQTAFSEPWRDPHIRFFTQRTLRALFEHNGFCLDLLDGDGFNLFNDLPILRKLFGSSRMTKASRLLAHFQHLRPSLLSSKLVLVASTEK
ncbi:MAG: hypothetical protein AB1393_04065 [Candidatus Edwardsbacteria bacterium]